MDLINDSESQKRFNYMCCFPKADVRTIINFQLLSFRYKIADRNQFPQSSWDLAVFENYRQTSGTQASKSILHLQSGEVDSYGTPSLGVPIATDQSFIVQPTPTLPKLHTILTSIPSSKFQPSQQQLPVPLLCLPNSTNPNQFQSFQTSLDFVEKVSEKTTSLSNPFPVGHLTAFRPWVRPSQSNLSPSLRSNRNDFNPQSLSASPNSHPTTTSDFHHIGNPTCEGASPADITGIHDLAQALRTIAAALPRC